jgi:ABC-type antimicrobial peptide transport system permease subunit
MVVFVKTSLEPSSILNSVRQLLSELDPGLPISHLQTMKELRDRNLAPQRLSFGLLATFAGVALLLATIGLYGVLAFTVTQRQREIGVRMALGASKRSVLWLIIRQGMKLAIFGTGFGVFAALALVRVLGTFLFEVKPVDPMTFLLVPLLLLVVAAAACWLPARCAALVHPMEALRCE